MKQPLDWPGGRRTEVELVMTTDGEVDTVTVVAIATRITLLSLHEPRS